VNSQVLGVIRNKIDNKPIEGVNILIGETGATTDKDGIFRIEYNLNEDIEFSHIGFRKLSLGKNIFLNNTDVYLIPRIIKTQEIYVTSGLSKKIFTSQNKALPF
jgi:hypothetical protein